MIKISVLYPYEERKKFDIDYYCNVHMPMVQEKLGGACRDVAVELGVSGPEPGSPPIYVAMGHLYFDTLEAFMESYGPNAKEIQADIANYTDIKPTKQISEVKL